MSKFKKIMLWGLVSVSIVVLGAFIYLRQSTYQATYEDDTFLSLSQVHQNLRIFEPLDHVLANIIIYPGGLVERDSYAYLAYLLSLEGYRVFLVGMPFNLAILNTDAAHDVMHDFPSDLKWYIGGHSLGGASASLYIKDHQDLYDGLFFLGAYPANSADLSEATLKVMSITAQNDLILNAKTYLETQRLLPSHTVYQSIEGGNHSYFGFYGQQKNDGIATISRNAQHLETVAMLINWIQST
ncbi:MAG: alpha/beta hydrolase [Acholeplasmataceae bacterium]